MVVAGAGSALRMDAADPRQEASQDHAQRTGPCYKGSENNCLFLLPIILIRS